VRASPEQLVILSIFFDEIKCIKTHRYNKLLYTQLTTIWKYCKCLVYLLYTKKTNWFR